MSTKEELFEKCPVNPMPVKVKIPAPIFMRRLFKTQYTYKRKSATVISPRPIKVTSTGMFVAPGTIIIDKDGNQNKIFGQCHFASGSNALNCPGTGYWLCF